MTDEERLALLRALAARPDGRVTQREVAEALRISKVEARRRLRAAASQGLVEVSLHETVHAPGRRVFALASPKGREELQRLEGQTP